MWIVRERPADFDARELDEVTEDLHGNRQPEVISCISDTVESYDNIYMSSMSFNPVYVHFAHEEVVEAQSQKNHR
ncbi:MAG: hypothetical protein R3F17_09120 [Planctomycetota bacterium]